MSDNSSSSSGIGLPGVLLVVFIVLKLTGTIAWSWWWVLSPLWISLGIFGVVGIPILIWAAYTAAKKPRIGGW